MITKVESVEEKPKNQGTFVGKAWINEFKDGKTGETKHQIKISLDRDIKELSIENGKEEMVLWMNTKREGKKDADYRVATQEVLKK